MFTMAWFMGPGAAVLLAGHAQMQSTIPEQILETLQSANALRTQVEQERSSWRHERARLELLLQTVEEEATRIDVETAGVQDEIRASQAEFAQYEEQCCRHESLRDAVEEVASRLDEALDAQTARSFPGVVPIGDMKVADDPGVRLSKALRRLRNAERAMESWSAEIVTGLLDGKERAVRLLRAGDAVAWWVSLDYSRAGIAHMREGMLVLDECDEPSVAERIRKALVIHEGTDVPTRVLLPLPKTMEIQTEEQETP